MDSALSFAVVFPCSLVGIPQAVSRQLYILKIAKVLPFDVHVPILAFVERRYLLSCALTCHAWLEACVDRLFESLYLRTRDDLDMLHPSQLTHWQPGYVRYATIDLHQFPAKSLISFLQSLPYLQIVHFTRDIPSLEQDLYPDTSPNTSNSNQLAIVSKGLYKSLLLQPINISTLQLSDLVFHSFTDILRICGGLHALTSLRLDAVTWQHTPRTMPPIHGLCHQLQQAEANRSCSNSSKRWYLLLWSCFKTAGKDSEASSDTHTDDLYHVVELVRRLRLVPADSDVTITCKPLLDRTRESHNLSNTLWS